MSWKLDDDDRYYLWWDGTLTFDPAGSTIELELTDALNTPIAGSPFAMTWQGSAVAAGSSWTQTARTNVKFCGSNVTPVGSDVKPGVGTYRAQVLVHTSDNQDVAAGYEDLRSE